MWQPDEISVIVGSNVYWKVTTGKIDQVTETLTVLTIHLRYVVFVPSGAIKCLHEPQTSTTIYLYGSKVFRSQERSAISLTTRLLAARTWKTQSRRTSTSMLVNAVCVDVVSASVSMVTSYLNNSSQTSHLLGDYDDRHCVFVILHAQHISLTHVKNTRHLISIGSRGSKGCDSHESTAVVHRHSR
ncbi:hypothetical protein HPB51_028126 [Rhipicephalus microplus]|uniref:Uncharacterized protein n=1 Tax=Rhipicephalus microplus TaxID=6941 RepID=A0A9J6CY91_RHIMP|nr:hypothetical protein HPB51_028126 [Rhipicephalus microplus]